MESITNFLFGNLVEIILLSVCDGGIKLGIVVERVGVESTFCWCLGVLKSISVSSKYRIFCLGAGISHIHCLLKCWKSYYGLVQQFLPSGEQHQHESMSRPAHPCRYNVQLLQFHCNESGLKVEGESYWQNNYVSLCQLREQYMYLFRYTSFTLLPVPIHSWIGEYRGSGAGGAGGAIAPQIYQWGSSAPKHLTGTSLYIQNRQSALFMLAVRNQQ